MSESNDLMDWDYIEAMKVFQVFRDDIDWGKAAACTDGQSLKKLISQKHFWARHPEEFAVLNELAKADLQIPYYVCAAYFQDEWLDEHHAAE